jgi:membrane-bound inhibitor of C-type lysozyme
MRSYLALALALTATTAVSAPAGAVEPVTYRCDDGSVVTATFLAVDPPAAIVIDQGRLYALAQQRAASGARYASRDEAPDVSFWTKASEALFAVAGRPERRCAVVSR